MPTPRALVLRAPGTNCDVETAFAFERAGALAQRVHVARLRERPALLAEYQILCLPGGFSYGDDIAAGRILADQLARLEDALRAFHAANKLILGICNGFQALLQTGLLLPPDERGPRATLAWNVGGKFECRWVRLGCQGDKCVFLRGLAELELPVAHGEGNFAPRDDATFAALDQSGRLPLRYLSASGQSPAAYPDNPNGARGDVAGVCDESGRVFGLMPHPERHIDPTQHPRWTREPRSRGDGLALFENAARWFA